MRSLVTILLGILFLIQEGFRSIVLASYSAGQNPTSVSASLVNGWNQTSSSTNVTGSTYMDGSRSVWRIHDPSSLLEIEILMRLKGFLPKD